MTYLSLPLYHVSEVIGLSKTKTEKKNASKRYEMGVISFVCQNHLNYTLAFNRIIFAIMCKRFSNWLLLQNFFKKPTVEMQTLIYTRAHSPPINTHAHLTHISTSED